MLLSGNFAPSGTGILTDWPLLRELQAVAAGRLCGPEERRRCHAESGSFVTWACAACEEFFQPEALSPWTWHLLFLFRLHQAGYPFRPNDLTIETWLLLGVVQNILGNTQRGKNGQRQIEGI